MVALRVTLAHEPLAAADVPRTLVEFARSVNASQLVIGVSRRSRLLAAERRRSRTGEGALVRLALSDVAFAITAALGRVAQGELGLDDGGKAGNDLYGAFGRDFATRDGERVMVVLRP